jgi:hypothetical protein
VRRIFLVGRGSIWYALVVALFAVLLTASACGGESGSSSENSSAGGSGTQAEAAPDPGDCTDEVDHPLLGLSSLKTKILEGTEKNPETGQTILTRAEIRVLEDSETVADYPAKPVESSGYEDGELVDKSIAYYTQCGDGSVWFVGEKVDEYEDGEISGHAGQWEAGQNGAQPSLWMPASPKAGQTFEHERVPDIAEGRATVTAVDVAVKTRAGRFTGCVKIQEHSTLEDSKEFKFYCPRVGVVREEGEGLNFNLLRFS